MIPERTHCVPFVQQDELLSGIDLCKVVNLYVVPSLSNGHLFDLIGKNIRCIVFEYNFINDEFVTKGVWSFTRLKKKFKKLSLLTVYNKFCDQLQVSLPENKKNIYICVFNYTDKIEPVIYSFNRSFKAQFDRNLLLGESNEQTIYYSNIYSNELIKNMVDWDKLLESTLNTRPTNHIFVYLMNMNNDSRYNESIELAEYIRLLHRALVPKDMINLIENEHNKQDLIVINVQHNLNDYFLLTHLDKVSSSKYRFTLISSPNDFSLIKKTIKVKKFGVI